MRRPRQKSEDHLKFIRQLPCLICLKEYSTDAAHIRYGDERAGKRPTGMGERPSDHFVVPLCRRCHDHQGEGEKKFWALHGIDPVRVALALWAATGDHELGDRIIRANAGTPSRVGWGRARAQST